MSGKWLLGSLGSKRTCGLVDAIGEKANRSNNIEVPKELIDYIPGGSAEPLQNSASSLIATDPLLLTELETKYLNPSEIGCSRFKVPGDIGKDPDKYTAPLSSAYSILRSASPEHLNRSNKMIKMLVPLVDQEPEMSKVGIGLSTVRKRGAVFLSLPHNCEHQEICLSINMAHEIGHQSLFNYQLADRILAGDLGAPTYSVAKMTKRPAILSFHALTAVVFMIEFIKELRHNKKWNTSQQDFIEQRFNKLIRNYDEGLKVFSEVKFTLLGSKIYEEFKSFREVC